MRQTLILLALILCACTDGAPPTPAPDPAGHKQADVWRYGTIRTFEFEGYRYTVYEYGGYHGGVCLLRTEKIEAAK